jgi:hypothetical protein
LSVGACVRTGYFAFVPVLIAACGGYPSQSNPTCSWTSQPPGNADAICKETFRTLTKVAQAEAKGDFKTIHTLVSNPSVAARIIDFGNSERAQGLKELHVVPSLTLGSLQTSDRTGVGFHLGGRRVHGSFEGTETVYMQIRGGRAVIVLDQPNEEW